MKKISILILLKMCNLGNKNVHFCVIKVRVSKSAWRQVSLPRLFNIYAIYAQGRDRLSAIAFYSKT
jgi:hypothetical protein